MIDRAIGLASLGVGVISLFFILRLSRTIRYSALVVGMLLCGGAVVTTLLPDGNAQSPVINQGPGSAYSYGQQGGMTVGTMNIGQLPRSLSPQQITQVATALRQRNPSGAIEVQTDLTGCVDCDSFAKQLEDVLRSAPGLTVKPVRNMMSAAVGMVRGMVLGVRDKDNPPESARLLADAFEPLGGRLPIVQIKPNDAGSDAVLVVGQSPSP